MSTKKSHQMNKGNISPNKPETKYHLYLKEKPIDEGLTFSEIRTILDAMPKNTELVPIDIEGQDHSCVYGFITMAMYDAIDYRYQRIKKLAKTKLFNTDSTDGDSFTDTVNGFPAYFCR